MQTSRYAIIIGAAALALGGCGKKDEAPPATGSNVAAEEMNAATPSPSFSPGQAFANQAAASDAFEIASSQMALTSSSSAAVKKFAQTMIDAHTKSTAKLKTAAAGAKPTITPDPALGADQQAALDGLKGKTGADFDAAYITAQKDGHKQTLDALRGYSVSGDQETLKAFAAETSPIVAAHLNMANALKP